MATITMQATTNIEIEFSKLKFSQNTKHPKSKVFWGVFFDVGYAGRQGCRPIRQDNQIRLCKVRADMESAPTV